MLFTSGSSNTTPSAVPQRPATGGVCGPAGPQRSLVSFLYWIGRHTAWNANRHLRPSSFNRPSHQRRRTAALRRLHYPLRPWRSRNDHAATITPPRSASSATLPLLPRSPPRAALPRAARPPRSVQDDFVPKAGEIDDRPPMLPRAFDFYYNFILPRRIAVGTDLTSRVVRRGPPVAPPYSALPLLTARRSSAPADRR